MRKILSLVLGLLWALPAFADLDSCRNLFDGQWRSGIYNTTNGTATESENRISNRNAIAIKPNTQYTVSSVSAASSMNALRWLFYDENKNFISFINQGTTITSPENARYLNFYIAKDFTLSNAPSDVQIEEGTTATAYVPYCSAPITIATTKYNETKFSPLNTALANAISVVDTVVSNTITQAGRIATLQAQKQTRPNDIADDNEKCPAGIKCLLVEDANGTPHWYAIQESYLPLGYTPLEYIESTGTQYIDTGVTINDQYSYELRYTLNGAGQSMGGIAGKVEFRENNSGSLKGFVYGSSNGAWSNENYSASDFTTTYKLQENKLYANGTLVNTFTPRTFTSTVNFNLFRRNIEPDSGFSIQYARGKLAYFKMWDENNTLVRDFIPAKNTDGKIGMYDLANGVFYENAGEGSFVAGPVAE